MSTTEFDITIRPANLHQIHEIVKEQGPLGSDACLVVRVNDKTIGWGDDYGTFHPLGKMSPGAHLQLQNAAELLLLNAVSLWQLTS